ncbi:P-loop containing nucleoside triphosphate hydrolase [Arabidopsis suecica]|uniref:P-loop containing nucleoside triphosphate hydrolase n=1 Tax=Arabidopsis suecica TaxID=45249 RepID=A0A8T2CSQ6_ARASU|nr:P-loop containing nucleoside triphosphate hydrolase [Arabidopsis suecica]
MFLIRGNYIVSQERGSKWGWKWRCGNIFGSNGRCRDRVKFIKDLAQEVTQAHSSISGDSGSVMRVERLIGWTAPTDGWLKLNTDGASHGNPGFATAGGVLRAASGSWSGGFAVNLGYCSAPVAELWGVYYGLFIAWERRATRVELEVDSQIVVGFLKKGISDSHPLSFLVRLCYGFLSKDWIVRINHVYREANRLADGLANYAFSLPLGFHMFDVPPDCVNSIMLEDVSGSTRPRNVIIFCTTVMVTRLVADLLGKLSLNVREIHFRKPQSYRTRVSDEFRKSKSIILVTFDVSVHGVDYPDVSLVVQMGLPLDNISIDLAELGGKVKKEKVYYCWHRGKSIFYLLLKTCPSQSRLYRQLTMRL